MTNFVKLCFLLKEKREDDSIFRIQKLDTKLLEFRNLIRETVYDACRFNTKLYIFIWPESDHCFALSFTFIIQSLPFANFCQSLI